MPEPRVLGGRYVLGDVVGSGGMADVYRAEDSLLGRTVAVKLLRDSVPDPGARERFRDEARTLARLSHPGLVTVLDVGTEGENQYLVMQYVDGTDLSRLLRSEGAQPPARVAALGNQVAQALAYAHANGIVHRDVKPGNILVDGDRVLLTDFGIARALGDAARHTRTGDTIGSPAYLSPEQVSGEPLTEAVDVYSLGLVLLEALTGARAYDGTPVEAAVARLTTAPAIPVSVGPVWRDLLEAMTRRLPEERPTLAAVAAVLEAEAAEGTGASFVPLVVPTPATEVEQTMAATMYTPAVRRSPLTAWWRWAVAAVVAVGLVVGGAVLLRPEQSPAVTAWKVPAGVSASLEPALKTLHASVDAALPGAEPLKTRLGLVDQSLAAHSYTQVRRDLTALAAQTRALRAGGSVSAAEADAILAAVAALRAGLPAPPTPTPTATPTPTVVKAPAAPTKKAPAKAKGNDKKSKPKGPGKKGKGKGKRK
ncbi:hypothetical protein ABIE44_003132 [Marmoricola sp. OAE513]|uniref:serine/threonine-protein kinase n=1 Tax=Marmoricola sp. OAE513 TaxID=2817894 RepID=UPI001AE9AB8F